MVAIVRIIERFSMAIGWIGALIMAPLILSIVLRGDVAPFLQRADVLGKLRGRLHAGRHDLHVRHGILSASVGTSGLISFRPDVAQGQGHVRTRWATSSLMIPVCAWVTFGLYEYAVEAYVANEGLGRVGVEPNHLAVPCGLGHRLHRLDAAGLRGIAEEHHDLTGIDIAQYGFGATEGHGMTLGIGLLMFPALMICIFIGFPVAFS